MFDCTDEGSCISELLITRFDIKIGFFSVGIFAISKMIIFSRGQSVAILEKKLMTMIDGYRSTRFGLKNEFVYFFFQDKTSAKVL